MHTATLPFKAKFNNYLSSAYPFIYIETHEENKVCSELLSVADKHDKMVLHEWDAISGLCKVVKEKEGDKVSRSLIKDTATIPQLISHIQKEKNERQVYILKDFHPFLKTPAVIRHLRNLIDTLKPKGNMVVFVSPVSEVPVELQKEVQYLEYGLPGEKALREKLYFTKESATSDQKKNIELSDDIADRAVEASKGMTEIEAENAFSLGIVENKKFDEGFVTTVFNEKITQVKKNSLLEYLNPDVTFKQIGGLVGIKSWITLRSKAYSTEARKYGLPFPRGILLAGCPGTGKTLISKAIANELGFPLFRLDVGGLFDKFVGQSEQNVRTVIKMVDGIGRCVLFIDEVEKALNKAATAGTGDTGASSRMFGTLLTWMSDHTTPVFVVCTTNNFLVLPPELIRKGRIDEAFWLDLPSDKDRKEIFQVLLTKYNQDNTKFSYKKLIENSPGYTGSEIENAITSAMFSCFSDGARPVETTDLVLALNQLIPQSKMNEEDINNMREQARGKLRFAAEENPVVEMVASDAKALRKLSA